MPVQAQTINPLLSENMPKSREQAARETLGNLDMLEMIRYGTSAYIHLLETDLENIPNSKTRSIDHERDSLTRLEKAVTTIGKLPKRKDYGGFENSRRDRRSGAVIFGESPKFGSPDVGQVKLKISKLDHTAYKETRRIPQPERMFFDTQVAYEIDVTSGLTNLDTQRREYTMDNTGIQILLDKDGAVLAIRGLQINGETNLTTEDLPYNDKMNFADLVENLDTIAN